MRDYNALIVDYRSITTSWHFVLICTFLELNSMDQPENLNWTNLVFYMDLFLEKSIYGRFQSLMYSQLIETIQISISCSERLKERNNWSRGENESSSQLVSTFAMTPKDCDFFLVETSEVFYVCRRGWLYVAKMVLHLAWPWRTVFRRSLLKKNLVFQQTSIQSKTHTGVLPVSLHSFSYVTI